MLCSFIFFLSSLSSRTSSLAYFLSLSWSRVRESAWGAQLVIHCPRAFHPRRGRRDLIPWLANGRQNERKLNYYFYFSLSPFFFLISSLFFISIFLLFFCTLFFFHSILLSSFIEKELWAKKKMNQSHPDARDTHNLHRTLPEMIDRPVNRSRLLPGGWHSKYSPEICMRQENLRSMQNCLLQSFYTFHSNLRAAMKLFCT